MSGLAFVYESKENPMEKYVVKERLCLTEDGRAVPEDDPDARWLYAIPGAKIPLEEAQRYGLIDASNNDQAAEPSPDAAGDEQASHNAELDEREQALADRESQASEKESALDARASELDEREQALAKREDELVSSAAAKPKSRPAAKRKAKGK